MTIHIAPAVRAAIPAVLAQRAVEYTGPFTCHECRKSGSAATTDLSVIIVRHPSSKRVLYAHSTCATSAIVDVAYDMDVAIEEDTVSVAGIRSTPHGDEAFLVVGVDAPIEVFDGGEGATPFVAGLLRAGFAIASSPDSRPPRTNLAHVVLHPDDQHGRVETHTGWTLLNTLPEIDPRWAVAARQARSVTMFAAKDLSLNADEEPGVDYAARVFAQVRAAGSRGDLVSARIAVQSPPGTGIRQPTTPDRIRRLDDDEVFVFGSNARGRHVGGAALTAWLCFGARWGRSTGHHGHSYAIDTMSGLDALTRGIDEFLEYADDHPELRFLVTPIGTGIAGHTAEKIAPHFAVAPANVTLPETFEAVLSQSARVDAPSEAS